MTETIAVLGANGVYARHLLPRLVSAGHSVRAVARRPDAAGIARACGVPIATANIFDTASMRAAFAGCSIAINLATTLPGPSGRGDFAANDRLRTVGTPNSTEACRDAGVKRIIQQSIGLVCASGDATWSDEDSPFKPTVETVASKAVSAALAMEETIVSSGLDWVILRGGLFYGPGTGFDDGWFARASAGKLRLPGDGSDYVSLVHIADMAAASTAAVTRWPSKSRLNVCDNEPAQWRDVFGFVASCVGQNPPESGGRVDFPSFRLRNARAVAALAWQPFYRTYREGLSR